MPFLFYLLLALLIASPIAWFVSEFTGNRLIRIVLGIIAIAVVTFCFSSLSDFLTVIEYNRWYGEATKELIETSIAQVDSGNVDRVTEAWKALDRNYHPTYENRAAYAELVENAVRRMRDDEDSNPRATEDSGG